MSSARSPAGTTIKIRAGGSGQSSMGTKTAAAPAPAPTAAAPAASPAKIVLKTAAATASSSSSSSSSSSAPVSKPVVTLAARPSASATAAVSSSSSSSSSSPAVPSAAKTAPTKPTYTASTSSSSSATAAPKVSVAPAVPVASKSSAYEPAAASSDAHTTPNGINLSLSSAESQAPNLLPPRTRSDRLRAAALAEDREEVVALLGMPGGVDVNAQDTYGNTALMLAASRGAHAICEELLELGGASVHLKDRYGQTALHFAAASASFECVQMLLARKAGVNVLTSKGQSALMKVAYISHPHSALIADLLLRSKAKPDWISGEGHTAASIAVQQDHLEILQVLAHYGADVNLKIGVQPPPSSAAAATAVGAAGAVSASASAPASSASSSKTLLHLAAARGSFTMISHLVALGADPSATDGEGRTMLQVPPPASAASPALSPKEFAARLQAAVDAGLAMREEHARIVQENAAIIARLKAERLQRLREEKIQAELQAAADAAVLAKAAASSTSTAARPSASSSASSSAGLLSPSRLAIESRVDSELGLAGRKVLYTDSEGVEHYSAPPSPSSSSGLTAQQLRERTYRPKIDPTSVFGDSGSVSVGSSDGSSSSGGVGGGNSSSGGAGVGGSSSASGGHHGFSAGLEREVGKMDREAEAEAEREEELGGGSTAQDDDEDEPISYHELLQARLHGTASGAARTAPRPLAAPLQDDHDQEEHEEMKMVSDNSY